MTPDKDFGQAVTKKTLIFKPARSGNAPEIMGPKEVCEKFGLNETKQIIDYLGMMGDAVDNIPGIPGVGAKTASKLLLEYGSMENMYENTDKIKGKLREKIEDNKDQAFLSKHLAKIITDVPVEFNESQLLRSKPNKEEINKLFKELEFRTLTKRVFSDTMSELKTVQGDLFSGSNKNLTELNTPIKNHEFNTLESTNHEYKLVDNQEKRNLLITELKDTKSFCFDTETSSLNELDAKVLGISFSYEKGRAFYVNMPADFEETKSILNEFKSIFLSEKIEKVAQNLKYDLKVLLKYGIKIAGPQEIFTNVNGPTFAKVLSNGVSTAQEFNANVDESLKELEKLNLELSVKFANINAKKELVDKYTAVINSWFNSPSSEISNFISKLDQLSKYQSLILEKTSKFESQENLIQAKTEESKNIAALIGKIAIVYDTWWLNDDHKNADLATNLNQLISLQSKLISIIANKDKTKSVAKELKKVDDAAVILETFSR
jgi:hypothetical protein